MYYVGLNKTFFKNENFAKYFTQSLPTNTIKFCLNLRKSSQLNRNTLRLQEPRSCNGSSFGKWLKSTLLTYKFDANKCMSMFCNSFVMCALRTRMSQLSPLPRNVFPSFTAVTALSQKWPPRRSKRDDLVL